jgi:hypothetical protein
VRQATQEREIDYPVAVDNAYEIWSAFANRYSPALYFVDADGTIRDQHFGEGRSRQGHGGRQRSRRARVGDRGASPSPSVVRGGGEWGCFEHWGAVASGFAVWLSWDDARCSILALVHV